MPCSECHQTGHNVKRCPEVYRQAMKTFEDERWNWMEEKLRPALDAPDPMVALRTLEVDGTWLRYADRGFCGFLKENGVTDEVVARYSAWRDEQRHRPTPKVHVVRVPDPAPVPSDPSRPARRVKRSRSTLPAG